MSTSFVPNQSRLQTQRDNSKVDCQWLCTSSYCPKSMSIFLCLWNDSPFPRRSRWLHLAPRASHSEPGPICHVMTDFHVQALSWIPSPTLSSDQCPPNDGGWCQAPHVTPWHCVTLRLSLRGCHRFGISPAGNDIISPCFVPPWRPGKDIFSWKETFWLKSDN